MWFKVKITTDSSQISLLFSSYWIFGGQVKDKRWFNYRIRRRRQVFIPVCMILFVNNVLEYHLHTQCKPICSNEDVLFVMNLMIAMEILPYFDSISSELV